jgi:hypothetical protein
MDILFRKTIEQCRQLGLVPVKGCHAIKVGGDSLGRPGPNGSLRLLTSGSEKFDNP